ncbi:MAG TPA: hypothetical protein PLO37_16155 [Candidatus Hydrogenedentes bacterium]|nr:hypothetical protein [Candidatus Hydrogenedentota bacterium]HPG68379.1 hypothetical protein [Candidatus Hydrogenedentota bacterium]
MSKFGNEWGVSRRRFLQSTMGASAAMLLRHSVAGSEALPGGASRLLQQIDCTQEYAPDEYFAHGAVQVIESGAGRYREAEGHPLSRFGYRFRIEHIGRPHVAIIRYPDDKRRYMCIMDGTCYDLTTGIFTGYAQPLSGRMLEVRQIFWPRWEDCSIVFMTWSEGEPAAAASIEIRELEDLAPLEVPGDPLDGSRRELGIQYEDPCGTGASEGAQAREEWIEHVVQYARHSGQGLLIYPMAWYHGPQFPCFGEPSDGFDCVVARDRKQYNRWTTHPADWYARLLERFGEEGLAFQGALTLMRLGSLMQQMNIDLASIQAGADTFNNMLWNDQVQASTNDWTWLYNVLNFEVIAETLKDKPYIEPYAGLSALAYGERLGGPYHTGPMFNPLHPTVQQAILHFVREIGTRYGAYPAFRGISFNMFAAAMPWFGSIHAGYDDLSVRLFQEETGIPVPVDAAAPDRFSRRYEYLNFVCRPAWVAWRCARIRRLFGEIHGVLAECRPDLRVTITLWDETVVPNTLGLPTAAHQVYARRGMLDLYRDAGIDPDLYRDQAGLEVDLGIGNSRDRGGHGSSPFGGIGLPPEECCMYRDFDFLDQPCLDAVHGLDRPGAFIFNCWVEAWGKHMWLKSEPDDPNLAEIGVMDGEPADGIVRMNSEYPRDGFWWDSQLRITPAFQGGVHFLEPYAHAVAELDATRITRGGLFLDKAHTEALQEFARAYRALPREKFETVGAQADPVAMRTLCKDGRRYVYVVNRDYYPVEVRVEFDAKPSGLRDLASGERIDASECWVISMGPYALRSFSVDEGVGVVGFTASVPPEIAAGLAQQAEAAFGRFAEARSSGKHIPGMDELERDMRDALAQGRFAWLRRALTGYIVRKVGGAPENA